MANMDMKEKNGDRKVADKTDWHRLAALVLTSVFKDLGYETESEIDLARKKQLIDIIVVRNKDVKQDFYKLPRILWDEFADLNEHNLISFKSYAESFTSTTLEEL